MLSPKFYINQNKILFQIVKIRETVLAVLFCLLDSCIKPKQASSPMFEFNLNPFQE